MNLIGMFYRIEDLIRNKGLSKNPSMRAFGMMSKLLTNAACGENRNVDGEDETFLGESYFSLPSVP